MSKNSVSDKLVPGKTIEYIEGEILSIKLSQWGVIGQLRTGFAIYEYKLKEPEMAKRILVGMKLEISNGFCVKSKSNKIVITDGKFGKINVGIRIGDYYHTEKNIDMLLTGNVKKLNQIGGNLEVELELSYPAQVIRKFSIPLQKEENDINFAQKLENSTNKIIRVEMEKSQSNAVCSIEILSEDHFWYRFEELKDGKLENATYFSQLIMKQREVIEEYVRTFTDLLFNLGKDLSKTTLLSLSNLLNSKIYNAEVKFPYTLLISENDIVNYLNTMIEFSRNFIYGSDVVKQPGDLLILINNFFPPYGLKTNNN
ncbi:MAG: hypothetical protein KAJ72_01760 [Candidatus Heimdallarchaeota archaeon]|nr:hypothetical protein [Candidatus Heimdallarchaeota archaeon]